MSDKKITITIGIPAYNEEANIDRLIEDLLLQKCLGFSIREIIISSDGSTDKTEKIVKSFSDPRIKLILNKDRKGIARGLNQIIAYAKGEILVTIDADVRILDHGFLKKLILPIVKGEADLTSAAIKALPPKTTLAKILFNSMELKSVLFRFLNNGNNIYKCYGLARAFSSKFYKTLHFPVSIGNDMYSYLECLSRGLQFRYVPESVVLYNLPENMADYQKQSLRFFASKTEQEKIFGTEFVKAHTRISFWVYFYAAFLSAPTLLKHPLVSIAYFFIQLYIRVRGESRSANSKKQVWDIATSSKKF